MQPHQVMLSANRVTSVFDQLAILQAWKLRELANLTGVATTGNKSTILSSLNDHLVAIKRPHTDLESTRTNIERPRRILSIDMGIRNLAYCILHPIYHDTSRSARLSRPREFGLSAWKRLDVVPASTNNTTSEAESKSQSAIANQWSPAALAPHAIRLTQHILDQRPDVILIERQRYRSGGASSVQEWTLRVNTLEAMLWSGLQMLRHVREREGTSVMSDFPDVLETSPGRICSFWHSRSPSISESTDPVASLLETLTARERPVASDGETSGVKRGFAKGEKISLVKTWLAEGSLRASVSETSSSTINDDLSTRIGAFVNGNRSVPKAQREKKLDDLADCVVQGVTYALWQDNKAVLQAHLAD